MIAILLLLSGCTTQPEAPASCEQMCASAATLYGGCLESWGLDWTAAGFADEDAFLTSCHTWSWEMALLQDAALEQDGFDDHLWLEKTCSSRSDDMSGDSAECSAFTDVEWNNVPWAPEDTGL